MVPEEKKGTEKYYDSENMEQKFKTLNKNKTKILQEPTPIFQQPKMIILLLLRETVSSFLECKNI